MMDEGKKLRSSRRQATFSVAFRLLPAEMTEVRRYLSEDDDLSAGQLARDALLAIVRGEEIERGPIRSVIFELWKTQPTEEQKALLRRGLACIDGTES